MGFHLSDAPRRRGRRLVAGGLGATAVLAGTLVGVTAGGGSAAAALSAQAVSAAAVSAAGCTGAAPQPIKHVVVVVMENHGYSSIIGSPSAPYINHLAAGCGLATSY